MTEACAICLKSFEDFPSTTYYTPVDPCGHVSHLVCHAAAIHPRCYLCNAGKPEVPLKDLLHLSRCAVCLLELSNSKQFTTLKPCKHICHSKCYKNSMDCYFCKKEPDGNSLLCLLPADILWIIASFVEDPDLVRLFQTCKRINQVFVNEKFWKLRCDQFELSYFVPDKKMWDVVTTWHARYQNIGMIPFYLFYFIPCDKGNCVPIRKNEHNYYFEDRPGVAYSFKKMVWDRKEFIACYPDRQSYPCTGHPLSHIKAIRGIAEPRLSHIKAPFIRVYKCKICGKINAGHYEKKCPG